MAHLPARVCDNCRFWSDQLARGHGDATAITAMCLAADGRLSGVYTMALNRCASWKSDHYGKMDDHEAIKRGVTKWYEAEQ